MKEDKKTIEDILADIEAETGSEVKAGGEPAEKISIYTGLPLSEITNL